MIVEGMTSSVSSSRQPDYFIGTNGIPLLVGRQRVKMDRSSMSTCGSTSSTDPVKQNKCLYNLTVRNGTVAGRPAKPVQSSGSKIESDIAIRSQYGNKSNSVTNNSSSSASSATMLSSSSNTSSVPSSSSSTPVLSNWRGPVASPVANCGDSRRNCRRAFITNTSSIPRSRNHNYVNRDSTSRQAAASTRLSSSGNSSISRISGVLGRGGDGGGSQTLLHSRQRRNVTAASDTNRIVNCGNSSNNSNVMRQCRLLAGVQNPPTSDNRLNYQRQYDRTIFGYNRLDQFVLPPLQI